MLSINKNKKRRFRPILALFLVLILIGSWFGAKLVWFKPMTIDQFYERAVLKYSLLDPQSMSQIGLLDKYHLDYYNDDLTDPSIEGMNRIIKLTGKELEILKSYDREKQSEAQLLSTDILAWYFNNLYEQQDFPMQGFPVNHFLGLQKNIIQFMCNTHKVRDKGDAKDYVERLNKFEDYFDKLVSSLKEREAAGVIPPKYLITGTLDEITSFVQIGAKANPLYTNFYDKVQGLRISKREKESLLKDAEKAIERKVYKGYKKLIDYYQELLPKSKDYVGIWNIPEGEEYYAYLIKSNTTLSITPQELFDSLEKELIKLNERLKELDEKALTSGTGGSSSGNAGKVQDKPATIEECQKYLDEIYNKLPQIVTLMPKTSVQIKKSPTASNGVYQYFPSDVDGSTPAIISVPASFPSDTLYNIKWLLYHEGMPGHHLQLALARELKNVPTFRKVVPFAAYTEGWATYAQNLPWELGLTQDEGIERDIIKNELFHIGRAVIDLGINYKRWTRQEAMAYAEKNNILDVSGAYGLVEYYTAYPGLGLPYAVGCMKIRELRDYAQKELGPKFDIREFHDEVLKNGAMPLDILDNQIKIYVSRKK